RVAFTRFNVFLRDRFKCQYCGDPFEASDLTFDHVIPRCRGGETSWQNVVAACRPCNGREDKFLTMEPAVGPEMPTPPGLLAPQRLAGRKGGCPAELSARKLAGLPLLGCRARSVELRREAKDEGAPRAFVRAWAAGANRRPPG